MFRKALLLSGLDLPEDNPLVVNAKLDFSVIDRFLWAAMQYEVSFDGGIRAPFFLRWPSRIAAGSIDARPVAQINIAPTLAAAAGAPLPEGVIIDGIDLLDAHLEDARDPIYPSYLEGPNIVDKTRAEPFEPGDEYFYWPN